jgi:hypothetical protein
MISSWRICLIVLATALILPVLGVRGANGRSTLSGHERVPGTVRLLKISWNGAQRPQIVITNLDKVRKVALAVDALPLNGPGTCSEGFVPPNITFSFLRSRKGPVLARASGVTNAQPGEFCAPTRLWVRGHPKQFLVEDSVLLQEVGQVLGRTLP